MDVARKLPEYTVDDIYALPEGQRAELVDGQLYMMAPPKTKHQRMLHKLCWEIETYIRSKNGKCEVFPAPFAVFLDDDNRNYVEPDISVICDGTKLDDKGCNGAPDWIIEIVSPGSRKMDFLVKLVKYRSSGVREYWIVDMEHNMVIVYHFKEEEDVGQYSFSDKVKAGIYDDFEIDFSKIEG